MTEMPKNDKMSKMLKHVKNHSEKMAKSAKYFLKKSILQNVKNESIENGPY